MSINVFFMENGITRNDLIPIYKFSVLIKTHLKFHVYFVIVLYFLGNSFFRVSKNSQYL